MKTIIGLALTAILSIVLAIHLAMRVSDYDRVSFDSLNHALGDAFK